MANAWGLCKLTDKYGRFVDCHIVPRSFLDLTQQRGESPLRVYSLHQRTRSKKSQTGIYDTEIVTNDGERVLARLDSSANRVLNAPIARRAYIKDERGFVARDQDGRRVGYMISPGFYADLKLFALSIFWRASVSKRPEFATFQLDREIETRIKALLSSSDPSSSEELSILITRYTNRLGAPFITPNRVTVMGVPFVQTTLGEYHFYMKTAAVETPQPIDELQLAPHRPLRVLIGDFFDTRFGQQIRSRFRQFYSDDAA